MATNDGTNYGSKHEEAFADEQSNAKLADEDSPSAPSLDQFDNPPGYEHVGLSPADLAPPPDTPLAGSTFAGEADAQSDVKFVEPLSETEVREALELYVKGSTFSRMSALKMLCITDITMNSSFHVSYNLLNHNLIV